MKKKQYFTPSSETVMLATPLLKDLHEASLPAHMMPVARQWTEVF